MPKISRFWQVFLGDILGVSELSIEDAAEAVGLSDITPSSLRLSLRRPATPRIAFAKLLVAYRPVWILDEPTAALDASADRLFAGLMRRPPAERAASLLPRPISRSGLRVPGH